MKDSSDALQLLFQLSKGVFAFSFCAFSLVPLAWLLAAIAITLGGNSANRTTSRAPSTRTFPKYLKSPSGEDTVVFWGILVIIFGMISGICAENGLPLWMTFATTAAGIYAVLLSIAAAGGLAMSLIGWVILPILHNLLIVKDEMEEPSPNRAETKDQKTK